MGCGTDVYYRRQGFNFSYTGQSNFQVKTVLNCSECGIIWMLGW
jgi:hypothetical protein